MKNLHAHVELTSGIFRGSPASFRSARLCPIPKVVRRSCYRISITKSQHASDNGKGCVRERIVVAAYSQKLRLADVRYGFHLISLERSDLLGAGTDLEGEREQSERCGCLFFFLPITKVWIQPGGTVCGFIKYKHSDSAATCVRDWDHTCYHECCLSVWFARRG